MKCPNCEGAGYMEYEHGLIRIGCSACGGTGQKADTRFEVVNSAIPLATESTEMIEVAPGKYEVPDDSRDRASVLIAITNNHTPAVELTPVPDAADVIIPPVEEVVIDRVELYRDDEQGITPIARIEVEADANTGNARTGKDNKPSRVKNPGKPKQREPRKPGGKATKKTI